MATEPELQNGPGNTKHRAYQLTLHEVDRLQELLENLHGYKSLDYLAAGALEVCPTTQKQHYHVYAHFRTPIRMNVKKTCGAHVEWCKGSPKQNISYLTKDGELTYEWGTIPHQGCATMADLMEHQPDEVPPQYKRIYDEELRKRRDIETFMNMLTEIEEDKLQAPEIVYITGGTGKGKTYSGYKEALATSPKDKIGKLTIQNNFVDVLNENADTFVIEEFRPSQMHAACFLQLIDKYGYRCNAKGKFVTLRPKKIIICNIIKPEEIYHDEVNQQFLRRITKRIELDVDSSIDI